MKPRWNGQWGGSGIEKATFDAIAWRIPSTDAIGLEIGSGLVSTTNFAKICKLYSVEDSEDWCNIVPNVTYIHAPLVDGWYNPSILLPQLPPRYDFIFIDGPCGGTRDGILEYFDKFNWDCLVVLHDTWRKTERALAKEIARRLNRAVEFHVEGDPNNATGSNGALDFFAIIECDKKIISYNPRTGRPNQ